MSRRRWLSVTSALLHECSICRYGGLKTAEERGEAAKWIIFANATFGEPYAPHTLQRQCGAAAPCERFARPPRQSTAAHQA